MKKTVRILDQHTGALQRKGGGLRLRRHQPAVKEGVPQIDRVKRYAVGIGTAVERNKKCFARDRIIGAEAAAPVVRDDILFYGPRSPGGIPL